MPSFTSFATLALALMSVSSTIAASRQDAAAHLLDKRATRGRPNHADLYGYPHGRGDHSGVRSPAPATNQHMTPGGYVDPRAANAGATCRYNSQCSTAITNARAVCATDGTCSYQCLGATTFDGSACTGSIVTKRCSYNAQCTTAVAHATGVCSSGHCTFACESGFYAYGSTCKTSAAECGGKTCPTVSNGYSTCVNNVCTSKCEAHLGYKMYCDSTNTTCQCVNTASDANNCGSPGNVCPAGYNNKGTAYCSNGTCQLSCHRLTKITPRSGSPYCA